MEQKKTLIALLNNAEALQEYAKKQGYNALLNNPPPKAWIKTYNNREYLPVNRVEWLMTKLFGGYSVEIKNIITIANSIVVAVRVRYYNPYLGKNEFQDGVGAAPIQTKSGAKAMDWNEVNTFAVQMAAPAAESYAFKDACQKIGKLFGRDLIRKDEFLADYSVLNKTDELKLNLNTNTNENSNGKLF